MIGTGWSKAAAFSCMYFKMGLEAEISCVLFLCGKFHGIVWKYVRKMFARIDTVRGKRFDNSFSFEIRRKFTQLSDPACLSYQKLQIFATYSFYIFITFLVGQVFSHSFWANFFEENFKIGQIKLTNIKLFGRIHFSQICKKFYTCRKSLKICVKLGKSCLVGLAGQSIAT
jgi:hypothetical protein